MGLVLVCELGLRGSGLRAGVVFFFFFFLCGFGVRQVFSQLIRAWVWGGGGGLWRKPSS